MSEFKSSTPLSADYPVQPVPFTSVKVDDCFWSPRFETNRERTVWYAFEKCEETGRISNFARAGGLEKGEFRGHPFDDSDLFKVVEGASTILAMGPNPKLDEYLDGVIAKIAAAQEADGYLYTARTLKSGHPRAGKDRWLNERGAQCPGQDSHELYNLGHLYEAAVAHYQATGKRTLLDVAIKSANLIAKTWGPGKLEIAPGHQEIELGLVKLYRATGDRKYLDLSKFLLNCRGNGKYEIPGGPLGTAYYSDDKPVTQMTAAEGHSVRSAYMYSAMADIAALTGDEAFLKAVDAIWANVANRKTYLTGGIGATAGIEGFGTDYELPNRAYNETCAAIANALWNQRMFLLHGDAKYVDVLERILYNGFISGVSFSGDKFFYPNPLETDGKDGFNHGANERSPWFDCSCCPVNDVRFIPSIAGFVYAEKGSDLFVNLFIGGIASLKLDGVPVQVKQESRYPWDGKVAITVVPEKAAEFTVNVRIPGWVRNQPMPGDLYRYDDDAKPGYTLSVNGKAVKVDLKKGYAPIRRRWETGDKIALEMDMPVRRVAANPKVEADVDRFAVERGPIVYCAEGADNPNGVLKAVLKGKATMTATTEPDLLRGVTTVTIQAEDGTRLKAIPYYAWCHRGPGEMAVWLRSK